MATTTKLPRNGQLVTAIFKPMTKEEARKEFPYRPASKYAESTFGGNNLADDIALLLNGDAERCKMCQAPTKKCYLVDGICPDCDGRAEANGSNPRTDHRK